MLGIPSVTGFDNKCCEKKRKKPSLSLRLTLSLTSQHTIQRNLQLWYIGSFQHPLYLYYSALIWMSVALFIFKISEKKGELLKLVLDIGYIKNVM